MDYIIIFIIDRKIQKSSSSKCQNVRILDIFVTLENGAKPEFA